MLLDLGFLLRHLPLVVAAVALVVVVKTVTTAASVFALGFGSAVAAASALTLAQVGEFSFVLERAGRDVGLSPAGLGDTGSQTFIASTVLLMVATPQLAWLGTRVSERLTRKRIRAAKRAAEAESQTLPDTFAHLQHHVIVAGYGEGAKRLVRVLDGSRVPFVITTLSPGGANEAEELGLPVLRGDSSRQHTLMLAGIDRAKTVVVADDEPATALRIVAVARSLAPTARIIVRTRYASDGEALTREGADLVVVEELESIVQMFADVLRQYRIAEEDITAHEDAIRRGGYAALREKSEEPVVVCSLNGECLDTRTVVVRPGARVVGLSADRLHTDTGLKLRGIDRAGARLDDGTSTILEGDVLTIEGAAEAFANSASLFRASDIALEDVDRRRTAGRIDLDATVTFTPHPQGRCTHLDSIRPVHPSAPGCEECLRIGDQWVHLRICLICGHVGCCDSSKNRHATKHFHATTHPVMRSIEPGDTWGWCYVDEVTL
jgi:K+:H+ antiporter